MITDNRAKWLYRVPRTQMFESFRSLHLLDGVALGDMHDDTFVTTFVDHHLSWTLGGPRRGG